MPAFSADAWSRNLALYDATLSMPFNAELAEGRLPLEAFRHYIVQDAKYLIAFGQALAVAAAKSDDPDGIVLFAGAAREAVVVERGLHEDYFGRFGLDAATVAARPMSPACHHYTSFLLATAFREPLPVVAAALLPCFWVYREVGTFIHGRAAPANPYRAWIDTYAGDDFAAAVDAMIATTDALAAAASPAELQAMHAAFTRAMQLEWMFWDSAHRRERWPA
ncbi:thiaminase II [Lichenibacterium minor]|uniref:Thiaminase II n=1 Tax=Lichenibacterium minor TaxID=2316528 RepID=A0A4V1RUR2_9HYPH|nr:TenA family protein [Lichenibacterium minor]RYC32044.1 thiaminase II [Lichenibacterium minor]